MIALHISTGLAPLPIDVVTSTFAILAKRGSGKTYSASVLAEEMVGAGLRICVLDPVGAWWGIRSSADGERPGLPVIVFGGERGDVDLREDMGVELADLVVDGTFSCVIDLSLLETKASTIRFVLAFAKRLYHRNRAPLHLFLDEADMFAPQKPMGEDAALLGAMENIVRRGRQRGLGVTMITQRAAVLNKNVLTQIETLLVLRTTSPQDRDAIDGWIEAQASKEERKRVIDTLPSLATGEAWVWSPSVLDVLARVTIRKRHTFDSGATPKVGEVRIEPKALAPVDIDAIRKALAPKVEAPKGKAAKGDMDAALVEENLRLALRVQELEGREVERVEVPVIDVEIAGEMRVHVARLRPIAEAFVRTADVLDRVVEMLTSQPRVGVPVSLESPPCEHFAPETVYGPGTAVHDPHQPRRESHDADRRAYATPPRKPEGIGAGAHRMLVALARFHRPLTRTQLATLAGYNASGGGFRNTLSELSTHEPALIAKEGDHVSLTSPGRKLAGPVKGPSTTAELIAMWNAKLGSGAQRMLAVLVTFYPKWISRAGLADRVDMELSGGGFRNVLSELSTNDLIEKDGQIVRASESLFLGSRA